MGRKKMVSSFRLRSRRPLLNRRLNGMQDSKVLYYNGELVNLYKFSEEHPEYTLFVIKGTWYEAALYAAVEGSEREDTDKALKYSYTDKDFDVVEKYDLIIGRVGGLL